ncbi:MAG TPA: Dam family site-specific DNA-(adenine-N6)-methyltransferase [Caldilineaceae bacterium]|nr:Dam family site-specific DNA-(adenine-N6)-methyltransferase [Caldilineaceae bacterium]
MCYKPIRLLRYPGGKQRLLSSLLPLLPSSHTIRGNFVEPFVGGASVFFAVNPDRAILSDINGELIELYQGIRDHPRDVWEKYTSFPASRDGYYSIRNAEVSALDPVTKAARILYLNRTSYKGMWRYNSRGQFNVGYGGESRRWVIKEEDILQASLRLRKAHLEISDFEQIIDSARASDFLFVDPPYKPGARELTNDHYVFSRFTSEDHQRLARALQKASGRGVKWAMTISSHHEMIQLFSSESVFLLKENIRKRENHCEQQGEALICNYKVNHL